ncbi:MAG: hypothetical protein EU535_07360, partial [Promethearchaeota archaeon]
MVSLNKLTVPYIDKLARELDIKFKSSSKKSEKIKKILTAGIPDNKLENLFTKYYNQYLESKGKPK